MTGERIRGTKDVLGFKHLSVEVVADVGLCIPTRIKRQSIIQIKRPISRLIIPQKHLKHDRLVNAVHDTLTILMVENGHDRAGLCPHSLLKRAVLLIVVPLSVVCGVDFFSAVPLVPLLAGW